MHRDETESGDSSESAWSVDSFTSASSSSSTVTMYRGERVERHELRLLQSVVRSIYYSADDEEDSGPEESSEGSVPEEGGLRPFLPSLLGVHRLDTVEEDEETDSSRETSPIPVSSVGASLDSSSAEDFDMSGLWDEENSDGAVEQVKQILCIIYFLKKILSQRFVQLGFHKCLNTLKKFLYIL